MRPALLYGTARWAVKKSRTKDAGSKNVHALVNEYWGWEVSLRHRIQNEFTRESLRVIDTRDKVREGLPRDEDPVGAILQLSRGQIQVDVGGCGEDGYWPGVRPRSHLWCSAANVVCGALRPFCVVFLPQFPRDA